MFSKIKLLITLVFVLILPCFVFALDKDKGINQHLFDTLRLNRVEDVVIGYNELTGKIRFIGTSHDNPIKLKETPRNIDKLSKDIYDKTGKFYIESIKNFIGVSDINNELKLIKFSENSYKDTFIRYQQTFYNIPVFPGEIIIQLNKNLQLISLTSKIVPDINIRTSPLIDSAKSKDIALKAVAKWYKEASDSLKIQEPELWIYNPIVFNIKNNKNYLVWKITVESKDLKPIKHLILVDAFDGKIRLHFNTIEKSLKRKIYDNYNNPELSLPGYGPVRMEGQGATGITDVDLAYEYMGDFYNFFKSNFNRDSIDGKGMTLVATVRYCETYDNCPYDNDFWSSQYQQIVLGDGTVTDDCVGHELGHAITDYSANLCYYMQSGAINESFSDIWGEFIDLTNGKGNDSPGYRWYLFEDDDSSRNMANPGMFDQPQRMSDYLYYCGTFDNGGVHTNSGVGNKTAYLITDGGYFNGYNISGLGITKTAQIYYETLTHLLTSGSDYIDLYYALYQGCMNLTGKYGITQYDCEQVRKATLATELNVSSKYCVYPKAPVCETGEPVDIFYDDIEGKAYWKLTPVTISSLPKYMYSSTYATSGTYSLYGENLDYLSDFAIAMKKSVPIPSNKIAYLHFDHAYDFESEESTMYDGGIVEYSTDGGITWHDAGSMIINNGYDGIIYTGAGNPLSGRYAYTGTSFGFTSSRLNLSSLGGKNVRFRFRIANDEAYADDGWYIDNIRIYTCQIKGIDLTGQWLNLNQTCRSGKCNIKGKFITQNTGTSVSTQFTVKFYLSSNNIFDEDDLLIKEIIIKTLKNDASKTLNLSIKLPSGTSASGKYIIAFVDANGTVGEIDENNNKIVFGPME
jgi:Zn-dependent metalloprotease